ncbi:hypothetical protein ANCCEY_05533 [Ancylostoma ceylanicum]|uniref:Uncharacterized protein n=1 Tax=Ancylostoma ceylanicum TaxID=53326 RepID=A0A0D6LU61_9BILA|nr:hypothetical protein ANCCEY_05533 [Ancylostoma ceylanicum]
MPEERTLDYVNRPEGEMDMMIGFFLMNGICVALVSRAIRTGALDKMKTESEDETNCLEKKEMQVQQDGNQVKVHVVPPRERRTPKTNSSAIEVESEAEVYPKTSIVRQNLLGPLSFDDLYYT